MKHLIKFGLLIVLLAPVAAFCQAIKPTEQFKQEFLQRINQTRARGCNCGTQYMPPVPPLTWNDLLAKSALGHAKDMFNQNYFSHTSKDGRTMNDRIMAAGYNYKGYKSFAIGENIAFGQESIAEVNAGWFKSEGHCKNLMNPNFKEIGIAQYDTYWVEDFGGRKAFSQQEQKLINSGKVRLIHSNFSEE